MNIDLHTARALLLSRYRAIARKDVGVLVIAGPRGTGPYHSGRSSYVGLTVRRVWLQRSVFIT
ncbi:MAG: hypothetical protein VYC65_05585 [Chloroflexota bacterium]|nr:hypothetical protein [Chloroflexota bacterium]